MSRLTNKRYKIKLKLQHKLCGNTTKRYKERLLHHKNNLRPRGRSSEKVCNIVFQDASSLGLLHYGLCFKLNAKEN